MGSLVVEPKSEHERIIRWRAETLHEAGFEFDTAQVLVPRLDLDLHKIVDMKRAGATDRQILLILL